jgi:hypothetical protein
LSEANLIVQAHNVFLCSATEGPSPRGTQFIAQQRAQFLDQLQLSVGQQEALTLHQQALFAIHHERIQHQQAVVPIGLPVFYSDTIPKAYCVRQEDSPPRSPEPTFAPDPQKYNFYAVRHGHRTGIF